MRIAQSCKDAREWRRYGDLAGDFHASAKPATH
jgi:hypothetical protein